MSAALSLIKWHACRDIDTKAGEVRQLLISDPSGQQRVYEAKLGEARELLANPGAVPGAYLAAEATRRGMSCLAVAAEVVAAAATYQTISPLIEAERVGGKADVRGAQDGEAVHLALAACLAALDAAAASLGNER